nr:ATP-binding protein [Bacteroidales bacterium]
GYIEIGYVLKNEFIQFYVKDTGIGISKNMADIIFSPFRKAKEDVYYANYSGTGLGLSISKTLVEMLGGKIRLESKENIGSIFSFSIPFVTIPENVTNTKIFNWYNKNAIIIEDNISNHFLIEEALKKTNINAISIDMNKSNNNFNNKKITPDIIIANISVKTKMYNKIIAFVKSFINTPVIGIVDNIYLIDKSKEDCCKEFVSKPVDVNLLLSKMNMLMKQT